MAMDAAYANLIPALWLIWLIYWYIAGRNVKATQRHESPASRAGHIVPLMIGAWLLWAPRLPGDAFLGKIIEPSLTLFFVGVGLVAAGLAFSIWARVHLGRNWSGTVTLKQDHELVRDGPYRYVRHPIYTGLLLAFVGCAVARDEWRVLIAIVVIYAALWRKLKLEERWMIEQFGDAYRRFIAEVPALVPNPFSARPAIPQ
jgi:protein-S-isoprenylcysteine O-methyltransferase Ste14